jgi:hypothetical protein
MNLRVANQNLLASLLWYLASIALILVVILSITRPMIPWDSWAYHFPFSANIFDINNYSKNFLLDKSLQIRYDGFPLLPEFLQGLLWIATNSLSATTLINSVSLAIFIIVTSKYGRANFPILVFGTLSIPLIAVHALSTYIDLFVGAWLAFQYLVAIIIYRHFSGAKVSSRLLVWYTLFISASFISGNSKMWAPVISLSIISFLFFSLLCMNGKSLSWNTWKKLIYVLMAASILSCASLIKNSIVYKNPIYPIEY